MVVQKSRDAFTTVVYCRRLRRPRRISPCRFAADYCELSWTVAPEARNKGFGKKMVQIAAEKIGGRITAQIKEGNEASVAIAKGIGLHLE